MWGQVARCFNAVFKDSGNFSFKQIWSTSNKVDISLFGSTLSSPFGLLFVRTNVRQHFPRASEYKRVKRHGYKLRMSTPAGRRIIMRRILKGRHVLSH